MGGVKVERAGDDSSTITCRNEVICTPCVKSCRSLYKDLESVGVEVLEEKEVEAGEPPVLRKRKKASFAVRRVIEQERTSTESEMVDISL